MTLRPHHLRHVPSDCTSAIGVCSASRESQTTAIGLLMSTVEKKIQTLQRNLMLIIDRDFANGENGGYLAGHVVGRAQSAEKRGDTKLHDSFLIKLSRRAESEVCGSWLKGIRGCPTMESPMSQQGCLSHAVFAGGSGAFAFCAW